MINQFNLLGGEIITPVEERFSNLYVSDNQVSLVEPKASNNASSLDVSGCYVTPGLIDLQVNGTDACDLWANPSKEEFDALCQQLLKSGVTAFLPTLITASPEHIKKNIAFLESLGVVGGNAVSGKSGEPTRAPVKVAAAKSKSNGLPLTVPGIHLEGPFLSPQRPGVHPKEFIENPTNSLLKELIRPSVKLVTIAPEQNDGELATKFLLAKGVTVSLGHSNATFDQASKAFASGIKMMTHTFNALPPLHHRDLGAVGAALCDNDVFCCVICDGLHVDPQMVKLLIRIKGVKKIVLVTDVAHIGTNGGGLVGSSIMLCDAVRNVVSWGAAGFAEAIRMATINPACAIKMDEQLGSISEGGAADLVVWDKKTLKIKHVIAKGRLIF